MTLGRITVKSNRQIAAGIFETVFETGSDLSGILPGQFISLYPKNPVLTLPRPFAVCDTEGSELKIVSMIVGKGTEELSQYSEGGTVKAMFPLGNGFDFEEAAKHRNHVLVGGSIGAAPLLLLAKTLSGMGCSVSTYLGFKSEALLVDEFKKYSEKLFVATDDGSRGEKGTVTELLNRHEPNGDMYYACGPVPMLKALDAYLRDRGAEGQFSLDERMACGFGACVGCAVKIRKAGSDDWQYLKVCKDGPVFNYRDIVWE